jgi:FemAB-related protein (PEP-CTERM system-associated)
MGICELEKEDERAWDEYVLKSDQSTFYHQLGWRNVVEETYKHKPIYLIAKEEAEIKGILPLFLVGNKLVSVPFAPYGGACADDETIEDLLIEKAKSITKDEKLDYLELRNVDKKNGFLTKETYVTVIIPLNPNPEVVWQKTSKGARRSTKKAIKNNIEVEMNHTYLSSFYELYARRNRELGSPVHSYDFFNNILEEFTDRSNIQVAKFDDTVIGTKFVLFFKDRFISGWAASDRRYQEYNPNNILTWELIKYGCENGYAYFDFGRSETNSGTFKFKKAWGDATPKQLHYQFYLNKAKTLPDTSQSNLKRKMFARFWKILPLSMTKTLGPKIRKGFP